MHPKQIPELITLFAEAVRADERGEGTEEERVHNYRETRSELACRFHKVLEERNESFEKGKHLQHAERELNKVRQECDALKAHILSLTDRLDEETILDSINEIQDWHERNPL